VNWDTVQQLVRIIMQIGAGFLVQRGLITEEMGVTLVGSLVSLAGIGWWALWESGRPADPPPITKA
jgi:hypothetical protein